MEREKNLQMVTLSDGRQLGMIHWAGNKNGRGPLVLLHGLLDSAEGWEDLAADSDREIFAFDLPGFGRSDLAHHATVQAYADDIIDALNVLKIKKFVLVGHSLGGATASLIAEQIPSRVSQLALLAPAGYGSLPLAKVADNMLGRVALTGAPLVLANPFLVNAGYSLIVSNHVQAHPQMLKRLMLNARKCLPGLRMATRALARISEKDNLLGQKKHRYNGEVTVLWGEKDHLVPLGHTENIHRAYPEANFYIWEGIGHHPQHEAPARTLQLLHLLSPLSKATA